MVALGLLGAFVVVMGGLSFEPTLTVYVTFQNPGGLQAGAPVRISGVKLGRVLAAMVFLALGVAGDVYIVTEKVMHSPAWAVFGAITTLIACYGLWFGVTLFARFRSEPHVGGTAGASSR